MKVLHGVGIDAARAASSGVVVVIDVLRAFTVSAFALAGGARDCLLVPTVDEARRLAATIPSSVLSAEENTLPVAGIEISNSPTQVHAANLRGCTLVQRTSAGTPVINAVREELHIYAASLVVARATAQACLLTGQETLTLIASADYPEDHACARYIEAIVAGGQADVDELLRPLYASDRYAQLARGDWPGFPASDLELALRPDRFDFAMPATREAGRVRLSARA